MLSPDGMLMPHPLSAIAVLPSSLGLDHATVPVSLHAVSEVSCSVKSSRCCARSISLDAAPFALGPSASRSGRAQLSTAQPYWDPPMPEAGWAVLGLGGRKRAYTRQLAT